MSHSEHNQTRRRLIKGIGALLLLSVSPVGLWQHHQWLPSGYGLHRLIHV